MATKAPGQSSSSSGRQSSGSSPRDTKPAGKSYDPRQDGAMHDSSDPRGDAAAGPAPSMDNPTPEFDPVERRLGQRERAAESLYNPSDQSDPDELDRGRAQTPEELAQSENNNSGYYNPGNQGRNGQGNIFGRNRRSFVLGGSVLGGGLVGIIISFMMLLPLKIEHIVQNLATNFTQNLTSAAIDQNTKLVSHYLEKYVLPSYKNCGTIVDDRCKVNILGPGNPVKNTYKAFAKARLEKQLAAEGMKLSYDTKQDEWIMFLDGDEIGLGKNGEQMVSVFEGNRKGRKDAKRAAQNAAKLKYKTDTALNIKMHYKGMMARYKIGRLATQIGGSKRCIVRCKINKKVNEKVSDALKSRFNFNANTNDPKRLAQLYMIERVLQPRAELTGIALFCILDDSCGADQTKTEPASEAGPCREGVDCSDGGVPKSDFEKQKIDELQALAKRFGVNDVAKYADLEKVFLDMQDRGFRDYATRKVLQKFLGEEVGDLAAKRVSAAIPYVGWVNLAAKMVKQANDAGPKVKKISYVITAAGAVQTFIMFQSYADEVHTGNVTAEEVGSFTEMLGSTTDTEKNPSQGGTAGAEGSPIYENIMNSAGQGSAQVSSGSSILSQLLPAKAYAEATNKPDPYTDYYCEDNGKKAPSKEKQICDNEILGQGIGVLNGLNKFLSEGPGAPIKAIAGVWNSTIGLAFTLIDKVSGVVGELIASAGQSALEKYCGSGSIINPLDFPPLNNIKPICSVKKTIEEEAPKVIEAAANEVLPNPFGSNMSGARNFNMMAAGANVLGNDSCAAAGCMTGDNATAIKIKKEQDDYDRYAFSQRPFTARMFDTSDRFSLVSRVAMTIPIDFQASLQRNFSKILSNPFGSLAHGFAGAVPFNKAHAAEEPNPDIFRIGNRVFPKSKIPADPEKYWDDNNCGDTSENGPIARWQKRSSDNANNGKVNPDTGMPIHEDVEPCLLIKYVTGISGGFVDPSLLSKDDLAETTLAGGASPAVDSANSTDVGDDAKQLAKEILANDNITYLYSAKDDIIKLSQGKTGTNGKPQDVRALQIVAALGKNHKVIVSALQSYGQGHSDGSDHYDGKALDIANIDGKVASSNITQFWDEIKDYSKGAIYLQGQCSGAKSVPQGMIRRPGDDCNHQHISFK